MVRACAQSANLTLNLRVDSEYVVALNQCTVVAVSIRIYLDNTREFLLLVLVSA